MSEIDPSNKFLVGLQGNELVVMKPWHRLSQEDALNLAAYLVTLCVDKSIEDFMKVYEAVCEL